MTLTGACHCGDTQFEIDVPSPTALTQCTCSICTKRGTLWVYCSPSEFSLLSHPQHDKVYQWGAKLMTSHFCNSCGCSTYNESPTSEDGKPNFEKPLIAVNARFLEGININSLDINEVDGKNLW